MNVIIYKTDLKNFERISFIADGNHAISKTDGVFFFAASRAESQDTETEAFQKKLLANGVTEYVTVNLDEDQMTVMTAEIFVKNEAGDGFVYGKEFLNFSAEDGVFFSYQDTSHAPQLEAFLLIDFISDSNYEVYQVGAFKDVLCELLGMTKQYRSAVFKPFRFTFEKIS